MTDAGLPVDCKLLQQSALATDTQIKPNTPVTPQNNLHCTYHNFTYTDANKFRRHMRDAHGYTIEQAAQLCPIQPRQYKKQQQQQQAIQQHSMQQQQQPLHHDAMQSTLPPLQYNPMQYSTQTNGASQHMSTQQHVQ